MEVVRSDFDRPRISVAFFTSNRPDLDSAAGGGFYVFAVHRIFHIRTALSHDDDTTDVDFRSRQFVVRHRLF